MKKIIEKKLPIKIFIFPKCSLAQNLSNFFCRWKISKLCHSAKISSKFYKKKCFTGLKCFTRPKLSQYSAYANANANFHFFTRPKFVSQFCHYAKNSSLPIKNFIFAQVFPISKNVSYFFANEKFQKCSLSQNFLTFLPKKFSLA